MSPVDAVFTHFPVTEHPELEAGRLGEEAKRLGGIFAEATPHSLILFNESLSATSHGESLHLNRDVVRALRRLGARSVMTTHLHELAAEADRLNREPPDDNGVVSLVSQVQEAGGGQGCGSGHVRRTFRIEEGPPAGCSYAGEIASQYGISYEQLEGLLRKRGLLD